MALVGIIGTIPFLVSSNYIFTFDDFSRSGSGRWSKHEIIGQKPVMEFLGPDVEKISLTISLRKENGADVVGSLKKLRKLRDEGTAVPFILGFRPVSQNYWILESLNESVKFWDKWGGMRSVDVQVSLQEYKTGGALSAYRKYLSS